jgi:hypothetical protein
MLALFVREQSEVIELFMADLAFERGNADYLDANQPRGYQERHCSPRRQQVLRPLVALAGRGNGKLVVCLSNMVLLLLSIR